MLELDELWSFVAQRSNQKWVWLALCRRTRQVVAYAVGDRSEATCRLLWKRIPAAYKGGLLYSDFWHSYQAVLPQEQHQPVGKESGQTNHIERKWANQPYRTLEQHAAAALGTLCEKNPLLFQVRCHARELLAAVPAPLQQTVP